MKVCIYKFVNHVYCGFDKWASYACKLTEDYCVTPSLKKQRLQRIEGSTFFWFYTGSFKVSFNKTNISLTGSMRKY